MAEVDVNGLFAIDVDADNYAESAAHDSTNNSVQNSRTFQSEEAFQAQKASYTAQIDTGNHYAELIKIVPCLADYQRQATDEKVDGGREEAKVKLGKKDVMLLGYAVGEMYYDRKFEKVVELCGRVEERCVVDGKLRESLRRWKEKCEARLSLLEHKKEEMSGGVAV